MKNVSKMSWIVFVVLSSSFGISSAVEFKSWAKSSSKDGVGVSASQLNKPMDPKDLFSQESLQHASHAHVHSIVEYVKHRDGQPAEKKLEDAIREAIGAPDGTDKKLVELACVCSGNTCRSPTCFHLLHSLLSKYIPKKFDGECDEEASGNKCIIKVVSGGTNNGINRPLWQVTPETAWILQSKQGGQTDAAKGKYNYLVRSHSELYMSDSEIAKFAPGCCSGGDPCHTDACFQNANSWQKDCPLSRCVVNGVQNRCDSDSDRDQSYTNRQEGSYNACSAQIGQSAHSVLDNEKYMTLNFAHQGTLVANDPTGPLYHRSQPINKMRHDEMEKNHGFYLAMDKGTALRLKGKKAADDDKNCQRQFENYNACGGSNNGEANTDKVFLMSEYAGGDQQVLDPFETVSHKDGCAGEEKGDVLFMTHALSNDLRKNGTSIQLDLKVPKQHTQLFDFVGQPKEQSIEKKLENVDCKGKVKITLNDRESNDSLRSASFELETISSRSCKTQCDRQDWNDIFTEFDNKRFFADWLYTCLEHGTCTTMEAGTAKEWQMVMKWIRYEYMAKDVEKYAISIANKVTNAISA